MTGLENVRPRFVIARLEWKLEGNRNKSMSFPKCKLELVCQWLALARFPTRLKFKRVQVRANWSELRRVLARIPPTNFQSGKFACCPRSSEYRIVPTLLLPLIKLSFLLLSLSLSLVYHNFNLEIKIIRDTSEFIYN